MTEPPPQPPSTLMSFLGTWLVDRVNIFFRLRRYIKMVAKRWTVLAACVAVSVSYATYLALHTPDIYSASSKIGIAPKILTPNLSQAQYLEELNSFYDRNLDVLTSSKLTARVDAQMKSHPPPAQPFQFTRNAFKGSGSFTLVVESTDLSYARQYARVWAHEFLRFRQEDRGSAFGSEAATTRSEIQDLERKLERVRNQLGDFRRKHNIGNIKETSVALQERLDQAIAEYEALKTRHRRYENKTAEDLITEQEAQPKTTPEKGAEGAAQKFPFEQSDPMLKFEGSQYSELKFQLKLKEAELARLSQILKPRHVVYARLEDETNQLSQKLFIQRGLIEEKLQATIASLKKDADSFEPVIADLKKQVLDSSNLTYAYEKLQEEETNIKESLVQLRRSEQALSTTSSASGDLTILEEGIGSDAPIRPNRRNMILAGLLLGLGVGMGIIYLLGRLDDRIELADDIESGLGEPVLGQIPQIDRASLKRETLLLTDLEEHNMFSESIRHVRSAVMFGGKGGTKQALLVTSAIPGDGKTTVTVNFAVTLAIAGHNVLLIDADLRRGNIHNYFSHPREPGFSEVLLGESHWSDVTRETQIKTLHVIPSGKIPANPGELLISPITQQFLDETRAAFDYVIFDCPPLTAIDDTFALVGQVDGLIFVVRSGHTSLRFARNALEAVRQRGAKLMGIVLNGITADNPYYYYRNYYHAYYHKGQEPPSKVSSSQIPAVKMAEPRNRHKFSAMSAVAKKMVGEKVTPAEIAADAQTKTEFFRKKSLASLQPPPGDTDNVDSPA